MFQIVLSFAANSYPPCHFNDNYLFTVQIVSRIEEIDKMVGFTSKLFVKLFFSSIYTQNVLIHWFANSLYAHINCPAYEYICRNIVAIYTPLKFYVNTYSEYSRQLNFYDITFQFYTSSATRGIYNRANDTKSRSILSLSLLIDKPH